MTALAESTVKTRPAHQVYLPGQDPEGRPIYSVLLKKSFDIGNDGICRRAQADRKILSGAVYYGDPKNSSVRFETDFYPYKLKTDVAFDGKAYSIGGVPVESLLATLSVGGIRKEVVVVGKRICRWIEGGRIAATQADPFTSIDLVYENAFGGADIYTDPKMPFLFPANPLGKGFVIKPTPKTLHDLELPNIENPQDRLTAERLCVLDINNWSAMPMPAGFNWIPAHWQPRMGLAGIMPGDAELERQLREAYAAVLSKGDRELYLKHPLPKMDFAFFNGAASGLSFPYLQGHEVFRLEALTPEGILEFQLPKEKPWIRMNIGFGNQDAEGFLHTVQIHGELRQIDMVWRACIPYPGLDWLQEMKELDLEVEWTA